MAQTKLPALQGSGEAQAPPPLGGTADSQRQGGGAGTYSQLRVLLVHSNRR